MFDLSIVIVNYNTKQDLHSCLSSIFNRQHKLVYEVIVVDNASSDGSTLMVKQNFPKAILVRNTRNLFFSKGNNTGLHKTKGKYVLILAPDTRLNKNTLGRMKVFMDRHPDCGMSSCRQIDEFGKLNPTGHTFPTPITEILEMPLFYRFFKNSSILRNFRYADWDRKKIKKIDTIPGSFMFGRNGVLKKVGFMDDRFKIYYSDLDLSKKIKDSGWENYHNGEVTITHLRSQSTKNIPPYHLMRIAYTDMLTYYHKYFNTPWYMLLFFVSRINLLYFKISESLILKNGKLPKKLTQSKNA